MDPASGRLGRVESQREVEILQELRDGLQRYLTLLRETEPFAPQNVADLRAMQQRLALRFRQEQHRFFEWSDGERRLNHDVFSLVEGDPEVLVDVPGTIDPIARRAIAKIEQLLETALRQREREG